MPTTSKKRPLRLFVCGPTIYDVLHIGNARTYLVFDALVRYLRFLGTEVFYLQNITDIDDKIIARAKQSGRTASQVARQYKKVYFSNMRQLDISSVSQYAPATKFIPQIVKQVARLIKKKHVYKTKDGYYFDLKTFPDYGKLAHRTMAQAEDGVSRIDDDVAKRNRGDFCVWKFSQLGEPAWKTPLGAGRPGWHIEDTAISEYFFGPQYDLHGGGIDLKFPHHEAEIAQQESASGKKPFVRTWLHVGALTVSGKKMSKSLGNFISINDFLGEYSPATLRLLVLSNHYRSPLNYTEETARAHRQSWNNLLEFMAKLEFVKSHSKLEDNAKSTEQTKKRIKVMSDQFYSALAKDFNTAQALSAIFEFISSIQPIIWKISPKEAATYRVGVSNLLSVLGFSIRSAKIPQEIKKLAKAREMARGNQQFVQSDELRKQINALGYTLDDTSFGPFLRPR